MRRIFFVHLLLILGVSICISQPPPPVSTEKTPNVRTITQAASLANLKGDDHFSSIEGRFTIALPKSISGFSALTPALMGINASGAQFQWRLREGFVIVSYHDFLDPNFQVKTEQDFVNYFGGVKAGFFDTLKAKLISEQNIKLDGYRGQKLVLELPSGLKIVTRTFYVDKRNYTFFAGASEGVANAETLISNALDSFALVSQSKIDADKLKSIESSTPAPLPQEPIVPKEKTDAQDENLNGKVKTVTKEDQDLSGTWTSQVRHFSSIEDYNEKGNLIKQISFDSSGNPFEITVYGYLNGARVSKYNSIRYEYDPPPMMLSTGPSKPDTKPRETRISYSYGYKYKDGKLVEMQMFHNDGVPGMRYTYTLKGNILENLVYDEKGKLNQKYVSKLDERGNEIEETNVDVFPSQTYGDRKYVTKYDSFDENGNWTKKTKSKYVMENGKEVLKPWYVSFRTITYFQ